LPEFFESANELLLGGESQYFLEIIEGIIGLLFA